jgi:hypothetical protein
MRRLVLLAAGLAAAAGVAGAGLLDDGPPPERFQGPARMTLVFAGQPATTRACDAGRPLPPRPWRRWACTRDGVTYAPDPCLYPNEAFARLLCHEKGHVNGWPPTHGK